MSSWAENLVSTYAPNATHDLVGLEEFPKLGYVTLTEVPKPGSNPYHRGLTQVDIIEPTGLTTPKIVLGERGLFDAAEVTHARGQSVTVVLHKANGEVEQRRLQDKNTEYLDSNDIFFARNETDEAVTLRRYVSPGLGQEETELRILEHFTRSDGRESLSSRYRLRSLGGYVVAVINPTFNNLFGKAAAEHL